MSKKDEEKVIGGIFIEEYNRKSGTNFILDEKYLRDREEETFPDLKFIDGGKHIEAEVTRATNKEFMAKTFKQNDYEVLELDPHGELFLALDKKFDKHYQGAEDLIILIHVHFYAERDELEFLRQALEKAVYGFKEIWAVWDDSKKYRPLKLFG